MRMGLSLALTQQLSGGSFSPTALFASGESGAWYDTSDLSTMFIDEAGTTPAVVDQPVGRINDKSGRGNHATQATTAAKPILRQDGSGFYYLEHDGVDDWLRATFTIAQPWDRVSALQQISWTGNDRIFSEANAALAGLLFQNGSSPRLNLNSGTLAGTSFDLAVGVNGITTERHGLAGRLAINNGAYATGDTGANVPGGITIGAASTGAAAGNIRFYGTIMIGRALTDAETTQAREFLASKSNVTL